MLNHGSLALIGQSGQYLVTPVGRFEVAWETDEEGPFIWEVIVRVGLAEGATKEDAELESVTLGEHRFEIEAHCGPDAEALGTRTTAGSANDGAYPVAPERIRDCT